jgi:stearoyl-CoA desaturase (delta-9 desaturase)
MSSDTAAPIPDAPGKKAGISWGALLWIGGIHLGALLAPFYFTWSGLVVFLVLYVVTGLGITLGYHRLLTHRSFHTNRFVEYLLTLCGVLANEGGPLRWAATHRRHHTHSDEGDDPHSPKHGFWWSHFGWWMHNDPVERRPDQGLHNVKDLAKLWGHRFFQRFHWLFPILLAGVLYGLGELWGGVGLSWVVWGIFARSVWVYHTTWLVNSATHVWGYRNFETKDDSKNLWWVAALTFGEGWHNNHHAHQRSARHGLRWWEFDITYMVIRAMAWVGLARDVHVAPTPKAKPGSRKSVWRILWPMKSRRRRLAMK